MKISLEDAINEQYNILLLERFINVFDKKELETYIDDIWNIMQLSYAPIGGFLSAKNKADLIQKVAFAKMVRKDNKIVAVSLYKDAHGKKRIASGTDGTSIGKLALRQILREDVKFDRSWGEVSGAMEHIMKKEGAVPYPNTLAAELLQREIVSLNPDGFHYQN